jgi:hypothetical protein
VARVMISQPIGLCDTDAKRRSSMLAPLPRLVLAGLVGALATAAQAQLFTHRDHSYSLAKTIAKTAIENCSTKGYRVSAVVVDRAGETI